MKHLYKNYKLKKKHNNFINNIGLYILLQIQFKNNKSMSITWQNRSRKFRITETLYKKSHYRR